MYDLIGDIHGYADHLEKLLAKLDYKKVDGIYRHLDRKIIFVGDFIDRGTQIKEVLEIVRPMIDSGYALAVMGNHEFNAIAYHSKNPNYEGEYLRPHTKTNVNQHKETLSQLGDSLTEYLAWFRTLPLWLDLPELRVVHACWDQNQIDFLANIYSPPMTDDFLIKATNKKQLTKEYLAIEDILKGKEVLLPAGSTFEDKAGVERNEVRIRWFEDLTGKSYLDIALPKMNIPNEEPLRIPVPNELLKNQLPYSKTEKPIFFGHYWLIEDKPQLLAENVCCLDFSVAKEGFLAAYRFDKGEGLGNDKFVVV